MKKIAVFILIFLPLSLLAEKSKPPEEPADPRLQPKAVQAVRADAPVVIDGLLNDKAWQGPPRSDFIQSDPVDGGAPSEETQVWVAYDNANLYVAAFCRDSDPASIRALLGRRDDELDSDWFAVSLDPYFDRRSGFEFCVNPAGSIIDLALSNDVQEDSTWDAVWDWKTQVNAQGWTLEMRIPLNQLRFPKKEEYVWGINFKRTIMRKNERDGLIWIPKDQIAYVSRFARLEGIRDIHPGTHLEFMPYSVGQAQFKPAEAGNPFETGRSFLGNLGFDLKVGLKSNLTLDATVNPDFGQVEVDPAVINLSAYETYYEEKRPFFIEGASLFNGFGRGGVYMNANINWPAPNFFYSRRIGRPPQGYPLH
ncbi:MAG: carbohydrate binding family 9 domain-containing protein, partial [Candidatus Aminicenantes bacterium]|nr:carbohydrate binding family 9 domain-containing protein [Candidatus Aminicenantes bacterium]